MTKNLTRLMIVVATVLILTAGIPAPVSAVDGPVLRLDNVSSMNPYLQFWLDPEVYNQPGTYDVKIQWAAYMKSGITIDSREAIASVFGSKQNGSSNNFAAPKIRLANNKAWQYDRLLFSSIGIYTIDGETKPGNLLRFCLWNAKGSLYVREVIIYSPSGEVVYQMSEDPALKQAVARMQSSAQTQIPLSQVSGDGFCWGTYQYGEGEYSAYVQSGDGFVTETTAPTTVSTTKNTTKTTTKATTKPTTKVTAMPSSATQTTVSSVTTTLPTSQSHTTESSSVTTTQQATPGSTTAPVTSQPDANVEDTDDDGISTWFIVAMLATLICFVVSLVVVLKRNK